MAGLSHTATFSSADTLPRILEDFACPACGLEDPGVTHKRVTDNKVRIFCDGCGAFVTFLVTREQADTFQRVCANSR